MPSQQLVVEEIPVTLTRKSMKNIRLAVKATTGEVRLSAPHHVSVTALKAFLYEHLPWLRSQQDEFLSRTEFLAPKYTNGEHHYFWGEEKPIKFVSPDDSVSLKADSAGTQLLGTAQGNTKIIPQAKRINNARLASQSYVLTPEQTHAQQALFDVYRAELQAAMDTWVPYFQERMALEANQWRIRKMKTRWGSCNILQKRIWLNLYLAAYPVRCLQYVIVHELAHLVEANHNARFWALVEAYFPSWREVRAELNRRQLVWC